MERHAIQVTLACSLGAFVGSLLGLEIGPNLRFAPFIGMAVGGATSYLAFDVLGITRGCMIATREIRIFLIQEAPSSIARSCRSLCDPLVKLYLAAIYFIIWIFLWSLSRWLLSLVSAPDDLVVPLFLAYLFIMLLATLLFLVIEFKECSVEQFTDRLSTLILFLNPIGLTLWMMVAVVRLAIKSPPYIVFALRTVGKFITILFLEIHSQCRLICLVDASIGALVGFLAGSALIGALVGGAVGLLNYELISKRLLKLVPQG